MLDLDQFEERAAIIEIDGGVSRFAAETTAARLQGKERWEIMNEIDKRNSKRGGDYCARSNGDAADDLPAMQRGASEEKRSLPIGNLRG